MCHHISFTIYERSHKILFLLDYDSWLLLWKFLAAVWNHSGEIFRIFSCFVQILICKKSVQCTAFFGTGRLAKKNRIKLEYIFCTLVPRVPPFSYPLHCRAHNSVVQCTVKKTAPQCSVLYCTEWNSNVHWTDPCQHTCTPAPIEQNF